MTATAKKVGRRDRFIGPVRMRAIAAALLAAPLSWGIVGIPFQFEYLANDIDYMLFALSVGRVSWFFETSGYLLLQIFRTGLVVGLPVSVLVGLPTYLLLKRYRRVSLFDAMVGGLVPGLVLSVVLFLLFLSGIVASDGANRLAQFLAGAGWLNLQAALTGPIFWLIRRPDRDEAPAHMPQPPAA